MPDTMQKQHLPRLLIVTRNLPPLVGGMERLNWHMVEELSKYAKIHVVGPKGSKALCPSGVQFTEVPLQPLWKFLVSSSIHAVHIAKKWRAHTVLAGSGLTAPAAWAAARAAGAQSSVYLHGLDAAVRHPVYRAIWHPVIRRMDKVIANSKPTSDLAITLGVEQQRISVIHPGVQLPTAPQPDYVLNDFRQRHNLINARILLSIGRLTTRKGLREFVEKSLPVIVREYPDVLLVVIGDAPSHSLHAKVQSRESIQAIADTVGVGANLRFLGVITDPIELASAYECAELHVFPVREMPGDPEGFGMVAIEAAAHGVPTVAFATGGVIDAVLNGQSGLLVMPGNYAEFSSKVISILDKGRRVWCKSAMIFSRKFAWSLFGERMIKVLNSK